MSLKPILARLLGAWVFSSAAWLYDWMTANSAWQASCANLLDPLPASAEGGLILDLGIGPGVSAMSMGARRSRVRFVGLDLSHPMLKRAHANRELAGWPARRLMLVQADADHLPLAGESFDAVAAHSFLYLLPDHHAALNEANRVVRSGGLAAFMEPNADRADWGWLLRQRSGRLLFSFSLWRFYNWLHGRFSPASLTAAFERAGFNEVDIENALGGFGIYGWARKR
ncbi:MAG: class I SAM-dependent methyltransferase [Anaerolineales bacterium]